MKVHLATGRKYLETPRRLNVPGVGLVTGAEITEELLARAGYFAFVPDQSEVPEGHRFARNEFDVGEDGVVRERAVYEPIPPPPPVPENVVAMASQLRGLLEGYFGKGAHVNRDVKEATVFAHVESERKGGRLSANAIYDALMMERLFGALTQYTGTGETWSLYERLEDQDDTD